MPSGSSTKVIIAGGGLGGLVLAILLQRAGIDYFILEQSVIIRPLGTVVVISAMVSPLMEQLGLLDEIESHSKPFGGITFLQDDHSFVGKIVLNNKKAIDQKERYGYYDQCIPRPDLYNIFLSRIPKERLKLGKRLVSFQNVHSSNDGENVNLYSTLSSPSERVMVRCSDGTYYYGDVLVGADGASSSVRQSLFRQMKEEGTLPKVDQEEQQFRQSWFMPVSGDRYSWLVTRTLEKPITINSGNSNLSEWGPVATGPGEATVGDLIDNTERHLIYKVMLEERTFRTWHGGRTVLIGDACHKSVPFMGKGAGESMLDAVVLASLLYDMPSSPTDPSTPSFKDYDALQDVFRQYYLTRADAAKEAVGVSSLFASLLVKEGWVGHVMRKAFFGLTTGRMARSKLDKFGYQKIQASFLPQVRHQGSSPCRPHVVSKRPVIGAGYYYTDDEIDDENYTISTEGKDGSNAEGDAEGTRSIGGSSLGRLKGIAEDQVFDHAVVDEFLTGVRPPNPVFT
ncbi:hypothetical protein BGZ80_003243 [Entomortierella chlamydospora]|uniref:FAD-binding domain-containing protein n=1 Tax=Entomortierella chlamydospora TaxID=101097 RepID=A0A9P6N2B1_9FUNG|nr:hypothetical protein BGZ79_001164 [Entomortierella chlamydospora]KAG0020988.1 hypothetical protein BGZ80_003243 [Entomortierella chlamydospora]